MRAKSLPLAGILLVSACASQSPNSPPKDSAPSVAPPAAASPAEPLLIIDPKKITVPYTLTPDAPSDVGEYWTECQNAKIKLVVDLQQKMSFALQSLHSEQSWGGPKTDADDQLIKSEQEDIGTATSQLAEVCNPYYIVDAPMLDAEIGPGVIHGTIIQIVDDQNMLMDVDFSYYSSIGEHESVWISGYPTQHRVDGSSVVGCFIPAGRTQYESATGRRTLHLFKPFNIRDYLTRR
jgi:hypothetical protein